MSKTEQETALLSTEKRTPLNLLSSVAAADPKAAFKSKEYRALFDLIEEHFGVIYPIVELKTKVF